MITLLNGSKILVSSRHNLARCKKWSFDEVSIYEAVSLIYLSHKVAGVRPSRVADVGTY